MPMDRPSTRRGHLQTCSSEPLREHHQENQNIVIIDFFARNFCNFGYSLYIMFAKSRERSL